MAAALEVERLFYTVFPISLGWMGLVASEGGLQNLLFPRSTRLEVVGQMPAISLRDDLAFGDLPKRLQGYFQGERVSFPDAVDMRDGTPFQREVWQALRTIPYGEVRSYAWLAEEIGHPGAQRAVGQALAANLVPIVLPCHRVVSSRGGLGGFRGGVALKRYLMEIEGGAPGRLTNPCHRLGGGRHSGGNP